MFIDEQLLIDSFYKQINLNYGLVTLIIIIHKYIQASSTATITIHVLKNLKRIILVTPTLSQSENHIYMFIIYLGINIFLPCFRLELNCKLVLDRACVKLSEKFILFRKFFIHI